MLKFVNGIKFEVNCTIPYGDIFYVNEWSYTNVIKNINVKMLFMLIIIIFKAFSDYGDIMILYGVFFILLFWSFELMYIDIET